jgi:hypothetical protein
MAVKVVTRTGFGDPYRSEIIRQGVEVEVLESERGQPILYVKDVSEDTIAVFQDWTYAIVLDGIEALEASRATIADEIEAGNHFEIPLNNGVEPE